MIRTLLRKIYAGLKSSQLSQSGERAYTIMEIVVSIAILSVGLAIAVPATIDSNRVYAKSDAINKFISEIGRAQNRAIAKGCRMIFTIDEKSYNYGCDYLPYKTENFTPDTVVDFATCGEAGNDDCQIVTVNLHKSIEIEAVPVENNVIIFNSKGMLVNPDGSLATASVKLKIIDRDGSGVFVPFADLDVLTTGVVNFRKAA